MALDIFNRSLDIIKTKKLFLLDQDGTLYNGSALFPQTKDFLNYIKGLGARYIFITNNSSQSVASYMQRMNAFGIKTSANDFFTSTEATIIFLKKHYPKAKVFAVGTTSFLEALKKEGIQLVSSVEADCALLAYDRELTYQKLIDLCELLSTKDIPYLATNPDWVCPIDFGYVPDCGSFAFMIEKATGKKPYFIGKPQPDMIEIIANKYQIQKKDVVVIGDRLYTDIQSAINAKVDSILVLSGEASLDDLKESSSQPTWVVNSIGELIT